MTMTAESGVDSWGIIGAGNIGSELLRQLGQQHVADRLRLSPVPDFVMRSSGMYDVNGEPLSAGRLEDLDNLPDVTFLATPTTDTGEPSADYIRTVLEDGRIAVTAEKGSVSSNFGELRERSDNFRRLGINATVGGGTRILDLAKCYATDTGNITQMHMTLNGTLSSVLSLVAPPQGSGMSLGQAVEQSVKLGYAEPGTKTPGDVIKQEAESDTPKKTAIFFNTLGLSEDYVSWEDFSFKLEDEEISRTLEEAKVRRFIVSFYALRHGNTPEHDIIGGFDTIIGEWQVVGGFRHIDKNPLFASIASITGPGAGMVIGLGPNESDGVYRINGPGAGVAPTVNTMIDDYVSRRALRS